MGVFENYNMFLQEAAEAATGLAVDIEVFRMSVKKLFPSVNAGTARPNCKVHMTDNRAGIEKDTRSGKYRG